MSAGLLDSLPPQARPPTPARTLIGRGPELETAQRLLVQGTRLLTLVGPGGVGKTRLALAIAHARADGAAFVDLSPLRDASLVLPTVAAALQVPEAPRRSPFELLSEALGDTRLMLVLDNCEQVLAAAPDLAALLAACAHLQVLATSREPLGLSWEQLLPVGPLGLPAPNVGAEPERLAETPAVALFVERARAVRPDFALTPQNAAAVAEVCRRLDGLPLGIELAAARSRLLSPEAMLGYLRERPLLLLSSGPRDAPSRHRTLREALAWSYDLLAPREQVAFARLSVFAGGCSLEAAEALGEDLPMLEALESLVDKHLVTADDVEGEPRFRLLETIREFALERLAERGEEPQARLRLAEHMLRLALEAEPGLRGNQQRAWLRRLEREQDNLRAVLDWAAESDPPTARELGLRLAGALWLFWRLRGLAREGRARIARLLAAVEPDAPAARAVALHAAGYLAFSQGDAPGAAALLSESLAAGRAAADRWSQAYALHGLGHVAFLQRDMHAAEERYTERVALAREQGDRYGEAQGLNALGEVARYQGDLETAAQRYAEALVLRRALGDTRGVAMSLFNLGQVAVARGDLALARAAFDEGVPLAHDLGSPYVMAVCLVGLAALAVRDGVPERAARLGGAAEAILQTLDSSLEPSDQRDYEATCAQARAALGETAFEAARAEGRRLDAVAALDARSPGAAPAAAAHPLSPREVEVARLIADGKTSREIADLLVITERTADTHAAHIRDKLNLRSRAEIAAWVTRQGLR